MAVTPGIRFEETVESFDCWRAVNYQERLGPSAPPRMRLLEEVSVCQCPAAWIQTGVRRSVCDCQRKFYRAPRAESQVRLRPICDTVPVMERIIPAAQHRTLMEGPLGAILLLASASTDGKLAVVEHPLAPRALGSPVHTHQHEDEYSIVLTGVVGVQVGDRTREADAGTVIVKPRGVPHAFWNPTDSPARLLEIISPGGFERYFEELGALLAQAGPPDPAAVAGIAERYGLQLDPTSIPQLVEQYGLRLG
jgi:quercetin dioxygenase-like cupin family protein